MGAAAFRLAEAVAGDAETPPPAKIVNAKAAAELATKVAEEVSGLAVSLEYFGKPAGGATTALIENVRFAPMTENGKAGEEAEEFGDDVHNVALRFDFKGMKDGSHVVFKIYKDSQETVEWRLVDVWGQGAEGSFETALAADGGDFAAGDFKIVGFVDGRYAMTGTFSITEAK